MIRKYSLGVFLGIAVCLPAAVSLRVSGAEPTGGGEHDVRSQWLPGPTEQWHVRMDTALAKARRDRKNIFILTTGTDRYGRCRKLSSEVLSSQEFISFAKEKLVLVCLDYSRSGSMPEHQNVYNRTLARSLHFYRGAPAAFVFDDRGRQIGRIDGYRPLEKYMASLRKILETPPKDRNYPQYPLPPEWVKKSPGELGPMLERLLKRERIAARRNELLKKISFELVSWGLEKDKVDRSFDPEKEIRVPVGTEIYFKVLYRMPENLPLVASLWMSREIRGPRQTISESGEFVSSLRCTQPGLQKRISVSLATGNENWGLQELSSCLVAWVPAAASRTGTAAASSRVLSGWLPGPTEQWHVRMDTALAAARKDHKKIFILTTGSDWCSWCQKLRKEVLSDKEFADFAREKLILVYLDYPRSKPQPEYQLLYNNALPRAMKFYRGAPAAFVCDEQGRQIGRISGYLPKEKYMKTLRRILASPVKKRRSPPPPEWVKKSPEELGPMLDRLLETKKQDAARAAQASEAARGKMSFEITAWGFAEDQVDRPFDPEKEIRIPAGTPVYFRVRYRMPESLRVTVYLQMPRVSISSFGHRISGSGEFVSMLCCNHPSRQTRMQLDAHLLMKENSIFRAAELPCLVIWED